jgi:hypothetical protein
MTPEEAESLGISIMYLKVFFGGEGYLDKIGHDPGAVFCKASVQRQNAHHHDGDARRTFSRSSRAIRRRRFW